MFKPDIVISWPRNCDYPLWRKFIQNNRSRFNQIIIVFTETNIGEDYREFVRKAMQPLDVWTANSPIVHGQDWRNVAVNYALVQSYNAEWLWFTEQDFMVTDERFWEDVQKQVDAGAPYISYMDGPRSHPCCMLIKRELLRLTDKDFSARPPLYDHFGLFTNQLDQAGVVHGNIDPQWCNHMAGLSHNMRLAAEGQEANYKPEEFREYLMKCLAAVIPQDKRFLDFANGYLSK